MTVELGTLLPAVAVLIAGIASSAWCLVHGSTIGASEMVERKEVSVWGRVLCVAGFTTLILGILSALMLMMPERLGLLISIAGEVIVVAAVLVVSVLGKLRIKTVVAIFLGVAGLSILILGVLSINILMMPEELGLLISIAGEVVIAVAILVSGKLQARKAATIFLGMAGVSSIPVFYVSGGDVGMITVEVWRPLLGALVMIGATICAAVCIMSAVKAGSAAMMEKSELSIWSLLFVALGEGLAIYGLIVALLLIM